MISHGPEQASVLRSRVDAGVAALLPHAAWNREAGDASQVPVDFMRISRMLILRQDLARSNLCSFPNHRFLFPIVRP